ncbi:response regulator transcription factor [Catenuloplanes atrovinosus]|uniref:DNA-binding NarL/FixJ family response regulator n=1 Tax=Catenuloplanes atrovinosus TaxID=137266 RepID=A0AAE3YN10_9ACTN|nr:response regulator transcription factor [Catenuloplanes atrovinosus]MDR7276803.1 DNA-binding NarL/FixJ family response regulator [Catenuloplanes atrovinosus]
MSRTSIVLVDDHVLVREGLREILGAQPDLDVLDEAGDSAGAVRAVRANRPDVVLLDVRIPGDDVTVTVRRIRAVSPDTAVVILTMYDGPALLRELITLGIAGYLLKSASQGELVAAVRNAGQRHAPVVLAVSRDSLLEAQDPAGRRPVLSPREREVLQLVGQAQSNAQVAARLGLAVPTVKRHLRSVFTKLGAVSRVDAVNKAVAASLLSAHHRRRVGEGA